jgi:activator of HSP90 ATPase
VSSNFHHRGVGHVDAGDAGIIPALYSAPIDAANFRSHATATLREQAMAFSFTLTDVIPATPREIYDAWLDSKGHTAMTGSAAEAAATKGGSFTAWGGYISGRNLKLEPGKRIVQSWRTTRFTKNDPDSQIEVLLEATGEGTRLTLHHTNVPDGHTGYQNGGWQEHYFEPMKRHFGEAR